MKLDSFLDKFATRESHNDGSKLAIDDEQFLIVYGPDSDTGREIIAERYRIAGGDDVPTKLRNLYARLIKDWSFDEPITADLVDELFVAYPQVYDLVVGHFAKRSNFTQGRSKNSVSTPSSKST